MRILFVIPYVPSLIRPRSFNLIRELSARHEVSVLAVGSRQDLDEADVIRRHCRRFEVVPMRLPDALQSCVRAGLRRESLQAAVCRSPRLQQRLDALLAAEQFDVLHLEHLRAAHLRAAVPRQLPAVFDSVDCISLLLERTRSASHSWRQRAIARFEQGPTQRFEAQIVRQFDRVAVTATDDHQALTRLAPDVDITVVPNGVDLDYFSPREDREPATLVFSGKMSYHANVTAALFLAREVFPLVRVAHPETRLRILGSGPPPEIRALASDPAIEVTGYVDDLRGLLGQSSIAVCPVQVKVGTQLKILEAMAMGLPVVSTGIGANGLPAVPGQDILVGDRPAELANHISRLLGDAALRRTLGQAGRRYVETHHRWSVSATRFETLYDEAISTRRDCAAPASR